MSDDVSIPFETDMIGAPGGMCFATCPQNQIEKKTKTKRAEYDDAAHHDTFFITLQQNKNKTWKEAKPNVFIWYSERTDDQHNS